MAIAAQMATLREPKRREAIGITDENSRTPMGIIAAFTPIMSALTPRVSRISDRSG
ncbi:MAG: hypothetical protein M5U09_15160 [Gammaproteobacteria bacterium]|nr:hypothetical protein [Gammaproteobacteria bacterium]